jgi:hypothetical protein
VVILRVSPDDFEVPTRDAVCFSRTRAPETTRVALAAFPTGSRVEKVVAGAVVDAPTILFEMMALRAEGEARTAACPTLGMASHATLLLTRNTMKHDATRYNFMKFNATQRDLCCVQVVRGSIISLRAN